MIYLPLNKDIFIKFINKMLFYCFRKFISKIFKQVYILFEVLIIEIEMIENCIHKILLNVPKCYLCIFHNKNNVYFTNESNTSNLYYLLLITVCKYITSIFYINY